MASHAVRFELHGALLVGSLTTEDHQGLCSWELDAVLPTALVSKLHPGDRLELVMVIESGVITQGEAIVDQFMVGSRGNTFHARGDGGLDPWPDV